MKALPRSTNIHKQIVAVRLYRDDLERIIGLMTEAGCDVRIADDSFQYDALDDLQKARGKSPQELTIEATRESSGDRIRVSKDGKYWYVSSDGDQNYALAREIEDLIRARQSAVEHFPLHWMFQGANLLFFGGLVLASSRWRIFAVVSVGAAAMVCTLGLTAYLHLYPRAILHYRHEAGFLARNRDAILLLLVGAIIGGVVGAIIQYAVSLIPSKVLP